MTNINTRADIARADFAASLMGEAQIDTLAAALGLPREAYLLSVGAGENPEDCACAGLRDEYATILSRITALGRQLESAGNSAALAV